MVKFVQSKILMILVAAILLLVAFMSRRKNRPNPSRLNMKKNNSTSFAGQGSDSGALNLIFQFEGRNWDAYEVLGVPAGSDFERIKTAYEKAPQTPLAQKAFAELCKRYQVPFTAVTGQLS